MTVVQVKGLSQLNQFLQQLPAKIEANVLAGALRAGAKVIHAEAVRLAPVDDGDLRASIRVRVRRHKGTVVARVVANAFNARWVEYGTAKHWIKVREDARPVRNTRRGQRAVSIRTLNRMAARGSLQIGGNFIGASVVHPGARKKPFLRPALDTKAREAVVAAANYIKRRLHTKHGLDTSTVEID